jgi:hypothetical protein
MPAARRPPIRAFGIGQPSILGSSGPEEAAGNLHRNLLKQMAWRVDLGGAWLNVHARHQGTTSLWVICGA